jgi:CubicO group peptidase (beta-lactamase class C family)
MTKRNKIEELYYPPPESKGGWRYYSNDMDVRLRAGMDPEKLERVLEKQLQMHGSDSWSIVIIRNGYLVKEYHTFNVLIPTRFDIWSCTKSFTGAAWALLLEDSRQNRLPKDKTVDLESPAYRYIPQGHPLSDPRKERITVRHLLTMTSGIAGVDEGVTGMPTGIDSGHYEHALGKCPNRFGKWVDKLVAEPGSKWDYSDPAFAHLSIMFSNITGMSMYEFVYQRILKEIGIEELSWDTAGGGGYLGPFSNAHTGIHISARELARFGYLYLRRGIWNGKQLLPSWWIESATKSSQKLNPGYGYTLWVNTFGTKWLHAPKDAFSLEGYRSNHCYVIPSLDLVVARVGTGPSMWREPVMIESIIRTML